VLGWDNLAADYCEGDICHRTTSTFVSVDRLIVMVGVNARGAAEHQEALIGMDNKLR
jgi:hypothetical protein